MATIANAQIGRDHYQVKIAAGKNSITADENVEKGGKNEGFTPYEIFVASLGACTCATLRMYADRKEMKLESVNVTLSLERDEEKNVTNISRQIELVGTLTNDERERLMQIAGKCPVHKVMSNPIHINTSAV